MDGVRALPPAAPAPDAIAKLPAPGANPIVAPLAAVARAPTVRAAPVPSPVRAVRATAGLRMHPAAITGTRRHCRYRQ